MKRIDLIYLTSLEFGICSTKSHSVSSRESSPSWSSSTGFQVDLSNGLKLPTTANSLSPFYQGPASLQYRRLSGKTGDGPAKPELKHVQTVASIEPVRNCSGSKPVDLENRISVQMTKSLQILNQVFLNHIIRLT